MKKVIYSTLLVLFISLTAAAQSDVPGDQNIAEDLTVQGSLGIGLDIGTPSFGFNTFIMAENNLRMFFDDTSISAGFPANDWMIELNSNLNGGDNYFGIRDATANTIPVYIQAGAGNNAIFVKSGGNVGFGTNNPARDLQITSGDTPGIRLEQNNTSGYSAQTWDVFGNEVGFFIRDETQAKYPFKIQPGAPTDAIYVRTNGNIGLGTPVPDHKLEIAGDAQVNSYFYFGDESTDGNWRVSVVAGKLTFEKREAGVWVTKAAME